MKAQRHLVLEKHSIILFFLLFVLYASVFLTKSMFSSAMAVIVEQGVMTKSQTGLINAAYWLFYATFQMVGGFIADKHSPFKLIVIGMCGAIVANLIIYLNQNYYVMLITWSLNAMIQFGIWPGIFKIISTETDRNVRGPAVLWCTLASSVGLGISMLVASFVKTWQNNFLISVFVLVAVLVLFIPVYRRLEKEMVVDTTEPQVKAKAPTEKAPMMPLVIKSGLIFILFIGFFRFTIEFGIKLMTPVMLMESYENLPAAISTRMSAVLVIFSIIATFLAQYTRKRIKYETNALLLYGFLAIPALVAVCFVGKIHYIWILLALSWVIVLICAATTFALSYVSTQFEKYGRIATVMGMLNGACIGNIFASYGFAKMAEVASWKWVAISWLAMGIVFVALCLIVHPIWKRFVDENG